MRRLFGGETEFAVTAVYIDKNRLFKMLEQIVFKGRNQ